MKNMDTVVVELSYTLFWIGGILESMVVVFGNSFRNFRNHSVSDEAQGFAGLVIGIGFTARLVSFFGLTTVRIAKKRNISGIICNGAYCLMGFVLATWKAVALFYAFFSWSKEFTYEESPPVVIGDVPYFPLEYSMICLYSAVYLLGDWDKIHGLIKFLGIFAFLLGPLGMALVHSIHLGATVGAYAYVTLASIMGLTTIGFFLIISPGVLFSFFFPLSIIPYHATFLLTILKNVSIPKIDTKISKKIQFLVILLPIVLLTFLGFAGLIVWYANVPLVILVVSSVSLGIQGIHHAFLFGIIMYKLSNNHMETIWIVIRWIVMSSWFFVGIIFYIYVDRNLGHYENPMSFFSLLIVPPFIYGIIITESGILILKSIIKEKTGNLQVYTTPEFEGETDSQDVDLREVDLVTE